MQDLSCWIIIIMLWIPLSVLELSIIPWSQGLMGHSVVLETQSRETELAGLGHYGFRFRRPKNMGGTYGGTSNSLRWGDSQEHLPLWVPQACLADAWSCPSPVAWGAPRRVFQLGPFTSALAFSVAFKQKAGECRTQRPDGASVTRSVPLASASPSSFLQFGNVIHLTVYDIYNFSFLRCCQELLKIKTLWESLCCYSTCVKSIWIQKIISRRNNCKQES